MKQNIEIKVLSSSEPLIEVRAPLGSKISSNERTAYDLYNDLFECIVADTDELIDECYSLRYQVYCIEHPFEEPNPELGEYEHDHYDVHAVHALLKHRPSGKYVGTVRVIIDYKDSPKRMPAIELSEENHIKLPEHIYTNPCGEISRFCISKDFRRRLTDTMYTSAYSQSELVEIDGRVIPFMAVGLMKMVISLCRQHDIRQCAAVMAPPLMRMLDKLGIHFVPAGDSIEHHGTRQISYITLNELYASLVNERPDILELITDRGASPLIY